MKINLLLCLLLIFFSSYSQERKLKKTLIQNFTSPEFQKSYLNNKNALQKILLRRGSKFDTQARNVLSLGKDEELIHSRNNIVYKIRYLGSNAKELVKYSNGFEDKKIEFTLDENVEALNEEGNMIYNDFSHGEASAYLFFSPDLELLNMYKPYEFGFKYTNYGFSSKYVCIYSQEKTKSERFKVSILDVNGNLLVEKEFNRGNYLVSDIKVVNNNFLILLNSTINGGDKILNLNDKLSLIWEKETSQRLVGYEIKTSASSETFIIGSQGKVSGNRIKDGKELWTIPTNSFVNSNSHLVNIEYVINGQYITIVTAIYKSNRFSNNTLNVFDIKNGVKIHSEFLSDSDQEVQIVSGIDSFLLINKNEVNEYR